MAKDLTTGNVFRTLTVFAVPLFLSNLFQTVYNLTDMLIVGRFVGKTALSAVSVGSDLLHLLLFFAVGFSSAGQVMIGQYVGSGHKEKLDRAIGTLLVVMESTALALALLCFFLRRQALNWLNAPAQSYEDAVTYVVVCLFGLVFTYGYNSICAILRGLGDSFHPFLIIVITTVINLALDLLFVAVFRWGVLGAALATIFGQAMSFLLAFFFLVRQRHTFGISLRPAQSAPQVEILSPLLRLGIPMTIQSISVNLSMLLVSSWINSYGVDVVSISGIGNKVMNVVTLQTNAVYTAGSAMVAQCLGAKKYKRVPGIIASSALINYSIAILASLLVYLFPQEIFRMFLPELEGSALIAAYIPSLIVSFLAGASRCSVMSLVNGSGNARLNLLIAILDGIVTRIGLSAFLGFGLSMGYQGFWMGGAIAGFIPFFIGGLFFLSGKWKTGSCT